MSSTSILGDSKHVEVDKGQLPLPAVESSVNPTNHSLSPKRFRILLVLLGSAMLFVGSARSSHSGSALPGLSFLSSLNTPASPPDDFFHTSARTDELCPSVADASSYSGWIGLEGDSDEVPKRSFYWLFEAEESPEDAPVILTIGGGPGTSGLINPFGGQSHCKISENGTVVNLHRWTQKFTLLALDHPIGVGLSYGTMVNNSVDAAHDAYDFLQKFYRVYPQLAKNKFVIASGSYGGRYVPNIATVVQEENKAIASGDGQLGAVHVNLEALLISNPWTDPIAYFRWLLYYRCELHPFYNASTCAALYGKLPECLDTISMAFQNSTVHNRRLADEKCETWGQLKGQNGTLTENINRHCDTEGDISKCYPAFNWLPNFLNSNETRKVLGVPDFVSFKALSNDVTNAFRSYGDNMFPTQKLYEPLLADGIRVLHHAGSLDANCPNPGTLSFLKLLNTPFSEAFRAGEDVPWPSEDEPQGTVRSVGPGAGNFTYLTYDNAGHFIVSDQTWQTKYVVEHFIDNVPFV
ncbi:alpha/beta-hydrolase [Peniophora sp. CONT]|nr:alpha/beta-hydrolase [Peniophora sp. CONT]